MASDMVRELIEAAKDVLEWADPCAIPGCQRNETSATRLHKAIAAMDHAAPESAPEVQTALGLSVRVIPGLPDNRVLMTDGKDAAIAALDAAEVPTKPEVAGWQPIETAPKDGTRVIMGFTKDENGYTMPSCEGFFNRKLVIPEWVWMAAPHSPLCPQPTHFMDMPEPPKETV